MPPVDTQVRYCHFLPVRQLESFRSYSEQAGITVSELMRRLNDYGLQPRVMNEVVPAMSGSFR